LEGCVLKRRDVYARNTIRTGFLSGKTGVTADRDKIECRLFNSSSIFNITLGEVLRR